MLANNAILFSENIQMRLTKYEMNHCIGKCFDCPLKKNVLQTRMYDFGVPSTLGRLCCTFTLSHYYVKCSIRNWNDDVIFYVTFFFFLHLEFVPPLATLHALFILFATKWYCPLQWRPSQVSLWYVECLLPLASLVYVSSQTSEALCAFTLLFFYDYVYLLIFTSHSRCTFMFFFFSGSTWTYLCVRFGCFQKLISLHDVIVGISLTFCFVSPQYQSLRLKLKNKRSGVCVCLREGHTYAHLFPVLFWDRVHCAKHV